MTINELAIKYKQTQDIVYRDELIKKLWGVIKYKSSYTFYRQRFRLREIYFTLQQIHDVELGDVEQELYLFTVFLLDKFDGERDFKKYYFTSIWKWKPSFLNKELYLKLKSTGLTDDEGQDKLERMEFPDEDDSFMYVQDIMSFVKNTDEKNILKLMYLQPTLNFSDIAAQLGISPSKVTRAVANMMSNEKLKNFIKSLQ